MIKSGLRLALSIGLLATAPSGFAHVDYFDLDARLFVDASGASWDQELFSQAGWYAGTQTILGDSHALAGGVFFKFHLDTAARVDIGFSDTAGSGRLNPAFSVYAGLLPDESHDNTRLDPLNPAHLVLSPAPHVIKDPSPVDNGQAHDTEGDVSPLRDTAHIEFAGQFNALGDWSMASEAADVHCLTQPGGICDSAALNAAAAAGEWSVIRYLTHVASTAGERAELSHYLLGPGDYTIAAGGNLAGATDTGILGTLDYRASPVPVPGALGLLGLGVFQLARYRRNWRAR